MSVYRKAYLCVLEKFYDVSLRSEIFISLNSVPTHVIYFIWKFLKNTFYSIYHQPCEFLSTAIKKITLQLFLGRTSLQ